MEKYPIILLLCTKTMKCEKEFECLKREIDSAYSMTWVVSKEYRVIMQILKQMKTCARLVV